jgi:hypothetical protein
MLEEAPRDAVVFVGLVVFSTLLLLVLSDLYLTLTQQPPIGKWVTQWARRYPMFAVALALVAGGMLGHFYFATSP